ncbi:hypothetical protein [Streptomyces sp. NPDC046985]|uniref:hypothetical protein n=1 Tax=Streptomyces sp. NPDC046985 TaxID=3155377 RepID=UPI00340ECBBA
MTPPAATADSSQPQTAAPLQRLLQDALREAGFEATVYPADDGAALNLTLYSRHTPFATEAAARWLDEAGVVADVTLDGGGSSSPVLTLHTEESVRRLIARLLDPWTRAYSALAPLVDLLEAHGVISDADVGTHAVALELPDDMLASAVILAALLGAPAIDAGLDLNRPRGLRRLADRMQWLVTGVVGSEVTATARRGCAHDPDRLTLRLTIEQAQRLTHRLDPTQAPPQSDRTPS